MAEFGVATTLITPAGNLVFNDTTSRPYLWLTGRDGGDGGELRTNVAAIPQRDGGYVMDAFEGPLTETFNGQIVADTFTSRRETEDSLRAKLKSIMRADGTLQWTPSGAAARQRTVRLVERLMIRGGILKEFQFQLVAADPLAYSTVEQSAQTAFLTAGTDSFKEITAANAGNQPAFPVVRAQGPFAGPVTLTNMSTGKLVRLTPSQALSSAQWIDVDMRAETAVFGTSAALAPPNLVANGSFESSLVGWTVWPNDQAISRGNTVAAYGSWSAQVSGLTGGGIGGGLSTSVTGVAAATVYSASVSVYNALSSRNFVIRLDWYNSSGGLISSASNTPTAIGTGAWTRIKYEGVTAPANAASVRMWVLDNNANGNAFGFHIDGARVEANATANDYDVWSAPPNALGFMDVAASEFWAIRAGSTDTVRMTVASGADGATTRATVFWRDAWA